MQWGALILTVAGCFATGVCFYLHRKNQRLKFLGLLLASLIFVGIYAGHLFLFLSPNDVVTSIISLLIEWGGVYCIALVLGALLLFIRESKPEFSQFPKIYAAMPVFVVLSYLLVYNTLVIKEWLMNVYQGGAVAVALLMYGYYTYEEPIFRTLAAGAVLFLVTYILSLALPSSLKIIWQIALALSIGTTFEGYLIVDNYYAEAS